MSHNSHNMAGFKSSYVPQNFSMALTVSWKGGHEETVQLWNISQHVFHHISGFRSFEGQKMCLSQMTAIWRPSRAVLRCRREPFFVRMALQDTPRKKGVKSVWPRDVRYVGKGEWQEEYRGAWGARRIFQSSYFIWSYDHILSYVNSVQPFLQP